MSPFPDRRYLEKGTIGKEGKKPPEQRFSRRDILIAVGSVAAGALGIHQAAKFLAERQERTGEHAQKMAEVKKYFQDFPEHFPGCDMEKIAAENAVRVVVAIRVPQNPEEKKKIEANLRALLERLRTNHTPLGLYVEGVSEQNLSQYNEALSLRKERLEAATHLERVTLGLQGGDLENMRERIRNLRETKSPAWEAVEKHLGVVAELMEQNKISLRPAENPKARLLLKTPEQRVKEAQGVPPEKRKEALLNEQKDLFLQNTAFETIAVLLCSDRHDLRGNVRSNNQENPEKATSLISVSLTPQR